MDSFRFSPSTAVHFRDVAALERVRDISRAQITQHPNPDFRITVLPDAEVEFLWLEDMFYRIAKAAERAEQLVLLLPNPYPGFARLTRLINRFEIDCRRLHLFAMDEFANESNEVAPESWPQSLVGAMRRYLYDQIAEHLRPPPSHFHGPTTQNINDMDVPDGSSKVRGTILVVVPEHEGLDPQADLASFTIFRAVVSELGDLDFAIQIVALSPDISEARDQLGRALGTMPIDGICAYASNIEAFRDLVGDLPVVTIGTRYPNTGSWVDLDFEKITYRLVSYLIERGHRRIAVIGGAWNEQRTFSRLAAGCQRAFEEANFPFNRELLHQAYEGESLVELATAVLRAQRPSAVFAEESKVCEATIAAAASLGLNIPDDLSIVSAGQMAHHITTPVRMTVVLPDNAAIGRESVRELVDRIDHKEVIRERILIDGPIVEGASVRAITP